ncbi:hypothetical protein TNCV_4814261 [Trichonephila clavipes]|nr:hypothetical protein TNCV_4814261 [Trichonephila clavipes]
MSSCLGATEVCRAAVAQWSRQINLEVDSDDAQELSDSRNQELSIDELTEMHQPEQDVEVFRPSSIRISNDG